MLHRVVSLFATVFCVVSLVAAEDLPEPQVVIDRVIAAAGGAAFAGLGILELEVTEEETRNDGSRTNTSYTLLVDTANLANLRIEYPGDVVVAATETGGWSTLKGVVDDRPQTPMRAETLLNQTAFPLLLPYSLEMEGVWAEEVRETVLDDREVWVLALPFAKGFFTNPVMATTWILVVAKDDYSIVSLEFAPAAEFRDVAPVGVKYRILKQKNLDGAKIAEQILAVGIDSQYLESGAHRVTKIEPSVRGPWDPTLFLSPEQLEALEQDD
jgi:hypothetical protein